MGQKAKRGKFDKHSDDARNKVELHRILDSVPGDDVTPRNRAERRLLARKAKKNGN